MNYQYRFGTTFTAATKTLYRDGGVRRYYQGIGAALVQGMSSALLFKALLNTVLPQDLFPDSETQQPTPVSSRSSSPIPI